MILAALALAALTQAHPPCTDVLICESIQLAAERYDVSYLLLECLAFQESTYNPLAVNGQYVGLFQFDAPTWALTPMSDHSRFNAYAAADGAAFLIARGEGRRWPPLAYCR